MGVNLLTATKSIVALKNFIEGDGLSNALHEVGTAEIDAAIDIANNLRHEKNKITAINRLLGHLESAYYNLYKSLTWKSAVVRPDKEEKIICQVHYICVLAALS